eukprot:79377-Amphidinium_carterae.2
MLGWYSGVRCMALHLCSLDAPKHYEAAEVTRLIEVLRKDCFISLDEGLSSTEPAASEHFMNLLRVSMPWQGTERRFFFQVLGLEAKVGNHPGNIFLPMMDTTPNQQVLTLGAEAGFSSFHCISSSRACVCVCARPDPDSGAAMREELRQYLNPPEKH